MRLSICILAFGLSAQAGWGQSGSEVDAPSAGAEAAAGGGFEISGMEPEDQTPTGKFTTAAEVRPILQATRDSIAAVREYDGKDWVYFTHLTAWRCGLKAVKYSINDGPMMDLDLADCHMKYKQPNVMVDGDPLPVFTFELGSVETIRVDLLFDDLTTDSVALKREDIMIP